MIYKLRKQFLSILFSIVVAICMMLAIVSCGQKKQNDQVEEALLAWSTQTSETVDYCDYYYAPMNMVVAGDNEFLPAVKVVDSQGERVALVSDKFLIEDMNGYSVTYVVAYNGKTFEKKITLNVVIANPNVIVGNMGTCYVGIECLIPTIAVMENDGEKIDYTYKVLDAQNQELAIVNDKFKATTTGAHFLTVSAQGKNGETIIYKEEFTAIDIPTSVNIPLKDTEINADWYTTQDGLMPEGLVVSGYKGVQSNGKNMTIALDLGISLELLKEKFVAIEIALMYKGDGQNSVYLKYSEEGEHQEVYFVQFEQFQDHFGHWQKYIVTVPTAEFDGNLYLSSSGNGETAYQFGFISATAICNGLIVETYEKEQMVIEEIILPTVKYVVNNVEQVDAEISVSATFNDQAIVLQDSNVFEEKGTLKLIYTCEGFQKTIYINVNRGKMLATKDNIISKITNVSCTKGEVQVGNITGGQYSGESSYGIKLPADSNGAFGGASVTIEIEVGDVSKFSKIEITFWALGIGGDTWSLYAGDTLLHSQQSWRGWDRPVIVQFSTSEVKNGKLNITFQQTWATGDELYIQSIEALL